MFVLSQISNCQSLSHKSKHENLKTDRIYFLCKPGLDSMFIEACGFLGTAGRIERDGSNSMARVEFMLKLLQEKGLPAASPASSEAPRVSAATAARAPRPVEPLAPRRDRNPLAGISWRSGHFARKGTGTEVPACCATPRATRSAGSGTVDSALRRAACPGEPAAATGAPTPARGAVAHSTRSCSA